MPEEQIYAFPNQNQNGITIRDFFAAHALYSLRPNLLRGMTYDQVAHYCFSYADAMMIRRQF